MNNQTRIELIETLIKTLETYRINTETPSIEQTLTGALQDEISNLMTENEFINWVDTGQWPRKLDVLTPVLILLEGVHSITCKRQGKEKPNGFIMTVKALWNN